MARYNVTISILVDAESVRDAIHSTLEKLPEGIMYKFVDVENMDEDEEIPT